MAGVTSSFESQQGAPLRVMMRARLLLGLYGDVTARTSLRLLALFHCLVLTYMITIITVIEAKQHKVVKLVKVMPIIIEYNANVLFSILADRNLLTFCDEIAKVDQEMGLHDAPFLSRRMKVTIIVAFTIKISAVTLCACYLLNLMTNWISIALIIMSFAVLLSHLYRTWYFDLLRHRFRLLRLGLEADLNGYDRDNVQKIKAIETGLKNYKSLVNILLSTSTWDKILICLSYISEFVKLLLYGNDFIWSVKLGRMEEQLSLVPLVLESIYTCLVACLPAVLCEFISKEVDSLKLLLANQQLVIYEDTAVYDALEHAEEYLQLRRARVTIVRACALGASLNLTFASLCTTYYIVMLQFAGIM